MSSRDELIRASSNSIGLESFPEDTHLEWKIVKTVHRGAFSFVEAEPVTRPGGESPYGPSMTFPYPRILYVLWFEQSDRPVTAAGFSVGEGPPSPFFTVPDTPTDWQSLLPVELFTYPRTVPTTPSSESRTINKILALVVFFTFLIGMLFLLLWLSGFNKLLLAGAVLMVGFFMCLILHGIHRHFWAIPRRARKMKAVAEQMGFTFHPQGDAALVAGWARFQLFGLSGSRRIANVIQGKADGCDVAIFDYESTSEMTRPEKGDLGTTIAERRHSVVLFRSDSLKLPVFALRPHESSGALVKAMLQMLKRLSGAWDSGRLGFRTLAFVSHPAFSKRCELFVPDETAEEHVRTLFSDPVLAYFEAHPCYCVEGNGNRLIVYRGGLFRSKQIKPARIPSFLEEARRMEALFQP